MPYFVVTCERGPNWDWSRPMRGQDGWDAHAAFMDALAAGGFIVAGGPLGGEDDARRVLYIVLANDAGEIERRLREDPWMPNGLLHALRIEPWTVLLGGFDAGSMS